jgi:predicted polyphosphate/ATP-dependent NAD kinase
MMLMREQHEQIASTMTDWKVLEKRSAESIEKIKAKCANPLICLMMDIIENDARIHERLQELIISSFQREPITLSLDEVGEVIELIREHTRIKGEMIQKTESMLVQLRDKSLRIQEFLLKTIIADEKKHKEMLEGVEKIRQGLYPYWPH